MIADGGTYRTGTMELLPRGRLTDQPGGMTLFEVLLVLVLLVVVGSLAIPLFEGSFASIRLRRGTDQVLATWSQARAQAIEAGQIYQFRFQPDAGSYRVERWLGGLEDDFYGSATSSRGSGIGGGAPVESAEATRAERELAEWELEASLPEDIVFHAAQRLTEDQFRQRSVTRLDQGRSSQWSDPILFYPDGTTTTASLLLTNGKSLFRRATLRALTGVARASDLLTREEANRLRAE